MRYLSEGVFRIFPFCPHDENNRIKYLMPFIQNFSLNLIRNSVFDNETMVDLLIQC
jgi:hypothetical protein